MGVGGGGWGKEFDLCVVPLKFWGRFIIRSEEMCGSLMAWGQFQMSCTDSFLPGDMREMNGMIYFL